MARIIPETLTEEELIKVLKGTPKETHRLAFYLGFYEGMRISEIVNLRPENIDKGQKLIRVKGGKGSKDRNVPIHPKIFRLLNPKKFPLGIGVRALQISFKNKCKNILIKDVHFHCLRHSDGTYYIIVERWDIRSVQIFLGHSKIQTTEIYTHVNPLDLVERLYGTSYK